MIKHLIYSLAIFLVLVLPAILMSTLIVPVLLMTKWDGHTTLFGNTKHGRGADHGYVGFWQELQWLVWRNPVNNLLTGLLGIKREEWISWDGDLGIGDKTHGGFYHIKMSDTWEYYWVQPYGRFCIRLRFGWKINGKKPGEGCEYVLTVNPFKPYLPSA